MEDNEEKEYDPALQFDALTAGIEDGGLRSKSSITILVCYVLAYCNEKVTAQNIIDAMVMGKIANYFEVSNSISKLIKKGYIIENDDKTLKITADCKFLVDIVENDLPYTIREKSVEMLSRVAIAEINKKENKVEIAKSGKGFSVTMHVSDVNVDFMTLTLNVPTQAQAEVIKEKFQEHPAKVYENLIDSIYE